MRNLLLAALAALAILLPSCKLDPGTNFSTGTEAFGPGTMLEMRNHSITADEVIMIADSGSSAELIIEAEVYNQSNQLVLEMDGCEKQVCSFDISSLNPGTYLAVIHTTTGTFSDYFVV